MMLIAMAVYDTPENKRTWMTEATLESLANMVNWSKHRLIVVDNASCQETQDVYEQYGFFPFFELIRNDANVGTAKAINQAWRHREPGEHCVKMDNDVVVHQLSWPHQMELVFARDAEIGIVGLKRRDVDASPYNVEEPSTIRMLPHKRGQSWIIVEEVKHVMGTCQAYSSLLLDKIGYLNQPGVYGFDDSLASIRAHMAGFKCVYLPAIGLDHIDPGGDAYCQWKRDEAGRRFPEFNTQVALYEMGAADIYYDGGFDG